MEGKLDGVVAKRRGSGVRAKVDALPVPHDLRATRYRLQSDEIVVFSYPLLQPSMPSTLTPAEADVLARIVDGATNRQIAVARKTSDRTVANQVAAVFRKLGVRSRAELVRKLAG